MKKISIINFKGGVGKTTLSFHLACYLAKEKRVLLVDVDHQSSLSIMLLGHELWNELSSKGNTVNRVFESFCNRKVLLPGSEIIVKNAMNARDPQYDLYKNLDVVPAQFELDDTEIDLASTNFGNVNLSDWEKRTLLANWLDKIENEGKYDYVIFDCPPATKIVSQNAISCSNCYIVPVIPDELSSRGVTHFEELVDRKIDKKLIYLKDSARVSEDQIPRNYVETTKMVGIAPFLVKQSGNAASGMTNIHTEQLVALRRKWKGGRLLKTVGKNYIGIPEAMDDGWPIWDHPGSNATDVVKTMMTKICNELKVRVDKI